MDTLLGLLIGIGAGVFSTWFPGMLNMQAVSTAVRAGRPRGYRFAFGMALVFPLQAGVSIFFANWLGDHPWLMDGLKQWAVPLLLFIGAIFIFKGVSVRKARKRQEVKPYGGGPVRRGFGMSMLNVLNIPLFLAISSWLLGHGYLPDAPIPKLVYVFGIGIGALLVFLLYARLADWFAHNAALLTRNINFLIGGLLMVLAVARAVQLSL